MKKLLMLVLFAGVVGGGIYWYVNNSGSPNLSESVLKFSEVRRVTIRDVVSATGFVEPGELVIVSAEMPGTIAQLHASIGDVFGENANLARLDDRKIKLKVEEAKNNVQLAHAAFLQAESAVAQADAACEAAARSVKIQLELAKAAPGIRSERELAEAQYQAALAGVKVAKAGVDVALAKKQAASTGLREAMLLLDMTKIKTPGVSGQRKFLVLDRKVHEGQMVGPQSGPIFTLAGSLEVVEVHAQVVEGDINKIREGLAVSFLVKNYRDEEEEVFTGQVMRIRPMATTTKPAVYYDAVVEVKNRKDPTTKDWLLRPGMTMSLDIIRREHKDAWRIPIDSLNFTLDPAYQDSDAKSRVDEWKRRPDAKDWHTLWTWDASANRARPVFVRLSGMKNGETGLKDAEGNEILEWEPGAEPANSLRVIIGTPPVRPPGFFDQPANVKI